MKRIAPELLWLWRHARPFRRLLAAQISAVLMGSLLGLFEPLVIKWVIDEVLPWHRSQMLPVVTAVFITVGLLWFGFNSLAQLLDSYLNQRIMLALRQKLLRHVQKLSAEYFVRTPPGDVLHRLEQDVDQLRELGSGTLASLVRICISTTLTVGILLILSWRLTLVILPLVPILMFLRFVALPRLRSASDQVVGLNAKRVSFLQEHLSSILEVQLLRREAGELRRFIGIARQGMASFVRRRSFELLAENATSLIMTVATAIVLGYGGKQVLDGALTIGGLVAFYTYLSRVFGPAQTLVSLYSALQRSGASIRRLMVLTEAKPAIADPRRPRSIPDHGPLDVAFENVSFSYGTQPVLNSFSATVKSGEAVALVGFTGSGKSTIGRLLTRFYDPQGGKLTLGGIPVRESRLRDLRKKVAYVSQEPILFNATLRENLVATADRIDEERLWEALRIAQIESFVSDLPEGLDTPVGVRGQKLSGGEKQRLAIARAILQQPRLLILDEATAGLDGITEQALLRSLEPLTKEMTILLIAHRISAIRWAKRVLVLDTGRLVDQGTHQELMLRSTLYRELCTKQLISSDPSEITPVPMNVQAFAGGAGL